MKGIVGTLAAVIGLGLILKFGGSSNALLGTGFSGLSGLSDSLLMSGTPGNSPPGVG